MMRDQALHTALCAQLQDTSSQLETASQQLAEYVASSASSTSDPEAVAARVAVDRLTAHMKLLRRELSAAGARAGRSLAAYETAIAEAAAMTVPVAAVPCPLCRRPLDHAQTLELSRHPASDVTSVEACPSGLPPMSSFCHSTAEMHQTSDASAIPSGLDSDTVAFILQNRARHSAAYERQRAGGCFFQQV